MLVMVPLDRVTGMVENIFPHLISKKKQGWGGEGSVKIIFLCKRKNKPTQKEECQSDYVLGKTAKLSVNNMSNIKKEGKKTKYNLFQRKSKSELTLLAITFLRTFHFYI